MSVSDKRVRRHSRPVGSRYLCIRGQAHSRKFWVVVGSPGARLFDSFSSHDERAWVTTKANLKMVSLQQDGTHQPVATYSTVTVYAETPKVCIVHDSWKGKDVPNPVSSISACGAAHGDLGGWALLPHSLRTTVGSIFSLSSDTGAVSTHHTAHPPPYRRAQHNMRRRAGGGSRGQIDKARWDTHRRNQSHPRRGGL